MQINAYSNAAMQINNNKLSSQTRETNTQSANSSKNIDKKVLDQLSAIGGKGMSAIYLAEFEQKAFNAVSGSMSAQNGVFNLFYQDDLSKAQGILSGIDFASIGYFGKNPMNMNSNELEDLLGENGFFGVQNTADRIADFVIQGAGNDAEKLKKGIEGMKRGFEEASKMWGGKLPQISQDTMDKALEKVNQRLDELGGKTLDIQI